MEVGIMVGTMEVVIMVAFSQVIMGVVIIEKHENHLNTSFVDSIIILHR
jgi:hypothetical protein